MFTLEYASLGGLSAITMSGLQMWINLSIVCLLGWMRVWATRPKYSLSRYLWGMALGFSLVTGWLLVLVPTITISF